MNDSDDKIWQAVLAAEEPTADELARAEAELRELGPVAPLATERVEAMVARASGGARPQRGAVWPVRRLLAAAVLMVSLVAAVSWFVRFGGRNSLQTLPFANAVLVITEAGHDDDARRSALFIIFQRCQVATSLLRDLSQSGDPSLAKAAKLVRTEALQLLASGGDRSPIVVNEHLDEWCSRLRMVDAPLRTREADLVDVRQVLLEGTRAILYCRLRSSEALESRSAYLTALRDELKD